MTEGGGGRVGGGGGGGRRLIYLFLRCKREIEGK